LTEEDLGSLLSAQEFLSGPAEQAGNQFGAESTLRAICAMFIQVTLFANNGDVVAAKAALLETMHQVWPVALDTSRRLVEGAVEQVNNGPAEERPN